MSHNEVRWIEVLTGTTSRLDVAQAVCDAQQRLIAGKLLVSSTDTVLGLVASAMHPEAVASIARIKGRDVATPPPVVVGSISEALALVLPGRRQVLEPFTSLWPGPLSLVVEVVPELARAVHPGGSSVALRVPSDPVLRAMARGLPLAASSANLHGLPTAATVEAALDQLAGGERQWAQLAARGVVAGLWWAPPSPLPSTVVDLVHSPPRILREGGVALDRLRPLL